MLAHTLQLIYSPQLLTYVLDGDLQPLSLHQLLVSKVFQLFNSDST